MRRKIYEVVHVYSGHPLSTVYKIFMICVIAISLVPLTSKETCTAFSVIDKACIIIYIADYILRWISYDYKTGIHSRESFIKYPLRLMSFIDLMSIFALLTTFEWFPVNSSAAKALMVFRVVRIFRYSKNIQTITGILVKSKKPLAAVGSLAVGYIIISALIVFNVEPSTFKSFFDAVYWSTISLTTVGYGDIYPVTAIGRFVAMLSSFFGIAIVALPAGVVTAEYMNTLKCSRGEETITEKEGEKIER